MHEPLAAWRLGARPRPLPRWRPAVVAVVVTAGVGAAAVGWVTQTRPSAPPVTACPPVTAGLHADLDGDGCDEALAFEDGVLVAGGRRLAVGRTGDAAAVGRWSCGAATLALLRPATGEVFRFDGWAGPGRSVPAVVVGRVDGAVNLDAVPSDSGPCDDLVVSRRGQPPVVVGRGAVAG